MRKAVTPTDERIQRYRRGRVSEWVAAAALLARGYRILGRRVRTPYGEIDLIAVRGRRLAFVEVKRRPTRLEGEAAITPRQAARIARAAEFWVSRNSAYRDHEQGLDVVLVMPNRLPAARARRATARFVWFAQSTLTRSKRSGLHRLSPRPTRKKAGGRRSGTTEEPATCR